MSILGCRGVLFLGLGWVFFSAWRGEVLFFGYVLSHGGGNIHGIRRIYKTIFAAIKGNSFVLDYLGNSSRTIIDLN